MSDCAVALADLLLTRYFGEDAVFVLRCIHFRGPATLKELVRLAAERLTPKTTASYVSVLLRHGVMKVKHGDSLTYDIDYRGLTQIARIPIYCRLCVLFYGSIAEHLLLVSFLTGMARATEVLRAALLRLTTDDKYKAAESLVECLDTLVNSGVIKASTKSMLLQPAEEGVQFERTSLSKIEILGNLHKFVAEGATRKNFRRFLPPTKKSSDWDLILTPNADSLEALWRDRLISQLAAERIDTTAGDIMSRILCVAVTSKECGHIMSPVSETVSHSQLIKSFEDPPQFLDSYLTLLLDDSFSLLEQKPGIAGGMYICPYKKVVKNILIRHIENIVQVLYENPGLRIFRILMSEGYLPHETLERRLLIPQHEFRKILPQMVASGFISTKEFSRSKEFNADTIVCLYHVNLPLVARLTIEYAQHCLLCIGSRYDAELAAKNRVIDQRYRVESLIHAHREKCVELERSGEVGDDREEQIKSHKESVQALQNSLTPAEVVQVTKLSNRLAKLSAAQWEAETAWFIADLYLRLHFDK
uniref:DNA-directed RNA polymerase III subunit RPC3 n=2 Tax=Mesocestoides corti TaxID=53468 RepID=A0A5K3FAP3_MESCO